MVIGGPVNHAKAFGRIAFSAPGGDLPGMEKMMKEANQTILTPYVSLDTPGKATVQVVILADPVSLSALALPKYKLLSTFIGVYLFKS